MRFSQLDRIVELIPQSKIIAERTLRPEEDFLRDHFPFFPVMPGVLMLEALFQASCWLVRNSNDFRNPLVMLREAKNVKFADFLQPNETLRVEAEILKSDGCLVSIKASGIKGGVTAVSARLVLELSELDGAGSTSSQFSSYSVRQQWDSLATGLAK